MIEINDVVGSLSHCLAAQRELELCRQRAQGDVDYFSYSYQQDFKQAQMDLEHALNVYIDQRVAQKLEQFNTLAAFEESLPAVRATPLAARPPVEPRRTPRTRRAMHRQERFVGTDVAAGSFSLVDARHAVT